MKSSVLASMVVVALAGCGGGGDSDTATTVEATAFSTTAKSSLAGDWPDAPNYMYYVVQDAQYWDQLWSARRAKLDCSRSFNTDACNATTPPAVDFSRYMVVGIYLGRSFDFPSQPAKVQVFHANGALTVDFKVVAQSVPRATDAAPTSEFFLIPTSNETLTFKPSAG